MKSLIWKSCVTEVALLELPLHISNYDMLFPLYDSSQKMSNKYQLEAFNIQYDLPICYNLSLINSFDAISI